MVQRAECITAECTFGAHHFRDSVPQSRHTERGRKAGRESEGDVVTSPTFRCRTVALLRTRRLSENITERESKVKDAFLPAAHSKRHFRDKGDELPARRNDLRLYENP